ncbi:hypothetical protein V6C27_00775 [Peptococcaceae bacterium 1198_IL3148]
MPMSPDERAILAYFSSSDDAQAAAKSLKQLGIEEVQVDRVSRYGYAPDAEINNPFSGEPSQTNLIIFSGTSDRFYSQDARILMAADPSVSGIGDTNYGVAGGNSFLVTAVTDEAHLDKALQLVKEKGGTI